MNASVSHAHGLAAAGVDAQLWTGSTTAARAAEAVGVRVFHDDAIAEPYRGLFSSEFWRRGREARETRAVLHQGARSWAWAWALWPSAVHAVRFPNHRIRDRRVFRNWLAVSSMHAAALRRERTLGFLSPRVATMRNGDIQTALRSTPMSRRGFREDGRFVIGALGSLSYRKGQDVLIEALAALRAAGVDAVVRLGGGGDPAPLCAKARALGVADHVVFLGWVDAVSFLSEIDVFCLPSRAEPFGIVLIEAMSQGAPVVASDVDGPADILEGGAGLLTPPGDVAALMEALRRVADDPDQAAVLADAGRRRAAERYAPKAIGETLIEAFRNFGARL